MAFSFNPFSGNFDLVKPGLINGRTDTFADLPLASSNAGEIYIVEQSTGVVFVNRQKAGLYISNGTTWEYLTSFTASQVPYDNAASGLASLDVKGAIDEIALSTSNIGSAYESALLNGTDLELTDIDGNTETVDLSSLLDNTNLARIVSANINASNILELVRDDASTMTVDLSQLDQTTEINSLQTQINSNDTEIADLISDLLDEVIDRTNVDNALQVEIDQNETDIINETTARQSADTLLQSQIDSNDSEIALNTSKVSFPEAPNDGTQYVRQSESWQSVTIQAPPVDSVNGQVGVVFLDKNDVGLDQVDNTSDVNKPVSIATQTALNGKVDNSQVLTNVPAGAVFTDNDTIYDDTAIQAEVDLNTAKISATGNELEASDLNTLAELNAIVTDATLINTTDPRLSDDRTPLAHTHIESDITDLDKYTQQEVDELLEDAVNVNLTTVTLIVAPDAASSQPGDFIGGIGILDAIREAGRIIIQNPTSFIDIRLRDGEYTLVAPIEIAHPQGKKVIRIRALSLTGVAENQTITSGLVLNDRDADDALLASQYNVIINCPSFGMFLDKGTGIETVDSIMFRYTGTVTSRAGVFCSQQGGVTIARCAFIGFPYGIRALEFSSVGLTVGNIFVYCNLNSARIEEMSVLRVTNSTNYRYVFHSITQYTILVLTNSYARLIGATTGGIDLHNDSTNRANVFLTASSTVTATRVHTHGGDEGMAATQSSFIAVNACTFTGNASYALLANITSTLQVLNIVGDPVGAGNTNVVLAQNNSNILETGTNTNITFSPAVGSVPDNSRIT